MQPSDENGGDKTNGKGITSFAKSVLEKILIAVATAAILAIPTRDIVIAMIHRVTPVPALPVGSIVAYWGSKDSIPEDYELCDGGPPKKAGAHLLGNKPNLLHTFLRGATDTTTDVRAGDPSLHGGADQTPSYTGETVGVALTIAQLPRHQHTVPFTDGAPGTHFFGEDKNQVTNVPISAGQRSGLAAVLTSPEGEGQTHSHQFTVPALSCLPTYQEVFFIIKVR